MLFRSWCGLGVGEVTDTVDHFDSGTECREFVDETSGGVADDEVVAALGEEACHRRAHIEAGVGHQGDPSCS